MNRKEARDEKLKIFRKEYEAGLKAALRQAVESNLKLNVFFIANGCCEECNKIDNQKMSLEEVLKNQPLPHNKCKRPRGCICLYGFETIRDNNGRLIEK